MTQSNDPEFDPKARANAIALLKAAEKRFDEELDLYVLVHNQFSTSVCDQGVLAEDPDEIERFKGRGMDYEVLKQLGLYIFKQDYKLQGSDPTVAYFFNLAQTEKFAGITWEIAQVLKMGDEAISINR